MNGSFWGALVLAMTGGNQRKDVLLLWGERFQCSLPKLMISMFSMTGLLCSKMPQEYKNDSFSSKEFWFRNSFLWTWQVHLASILVTIYLRGWEKWTQPALITVMKILSLTCVLISLDYNVYRNSLYCLGTTRGSSEPHTYSILPNPPTFKPSLLSNPAHLLFGTPTKECPECRFKIFFNIGKGCFPGTLRSEVPIC